MTTQIISAMTLICAVASTARAAPDGPTPMIPVLLRPVTWSSAVAGPNRAELDGALDKSLLEPWSMVDRKTGRRQEARTCRELLALDTTSEPMEIPKDGSPPHPVSQNDWDVYVGHRVTCRILAAIQQAKPAHADHLGQFSLTSARLREIPAAVIPTSSPWEEKRLQQASARGVSWKQWDRKVHVTSTVGGGITVRGTDTSCFLTVRARGDFDGDGVDDLLLFRTGHGQEGTWSSTAGFVLTRRSPHGRVEIVKVIE